MRKAIVVLAAVLSLIPLVATAQNDPPVVDAGEDQTMYLGDSVTLHGTATGDPGVWLWEVVSAPGGSNYSLAGADTPNVTFSTDTLGDYLITLEAWNYFGWSDPDAVVVTVVENLPPVAVADASPTTGAAPLTVSFDGTGSYDPEGGELLYDWDFGDMTSGTEANTTHEYQFPGTYLGRLMVGDDHGNIDFDTVEITVEEPTPGWGGASVVGMQPESPSTGLNCLIGLLIPLGVVLLLKRLRRR